MVISLLSAIYFSLCIFIQTLILAYAHPPFNLSHFIPPFSTELDLPPQPPPFLQDILRVVSLRRGWNKSDEVRVSKLDSANARFGGSSRYEFLFQVGETQLVFKISDDVSRWKKMAVEKGKNFESSVKDIGSMMVIDDFQIKGPLELITRGDDKLSLHLPRNTSHAGLNRILVSEDITLEIKNAQEVSVFFPSELGKNITRGQKRKQFWPLHHSFCESLLPIYISGSAIVSAYRDRNPNSYIQSKYQYKDTIELVSEKCYSGNNYKKWNHQMESVNSRIALMEKLLKSVLGGNVSENGNFSFLRVNITASTVVRFKIELERSIKKDENVRGKLGEWRTRPSIERFWFEVVARIEGEKLKPIKIKNIKPFVEVDSSSWSNFMSNISFTKFPSLLVPQEDLTLGVK